MINQQCNDDIHSTTPDRKPILFHPVRPNFKLRMNGRGRHQYKNKSIAGLEIPSGHMRFLLFEPIQTFFGIIVIVNIMFSILVRCGVPVTCHTTHAFLERLINILLTRPFRDLT